MRDRLETTRFAVEREFRVGACEATAIVGIYQDGRPGELFVKFKHGADSGIVGLTCAVATAVSIALQHGAPLETFVDKFRHTKFEPAGLTDDENQRMASSLLDYIFGWMDRRFGKKVTDGDCDFEA